MNQEALDAALDRVLGADGRRKIEICRVGEGAAEDLAAFARELGCRSALALFDANTWAVGGDGVCSALSAAGIGISRKDLGAKPIEASASLGEEVAAACEGVDACVAIGSGTICDLAKFAGDALGKPALLYATAPSMNGYTSGIVAIRLRGLKRTLPCVPAKGVFAEPAVVASAPQPMLAAGVGDYLSKCSASADWRAAHFLRGEPYDEEALRFYEGTLDRVLASVEGVGRGEAMAVAEVFEALLLSGLSMLAAGTSSPASGGEHLISHFLDMKAAIRGTPHDLHGAQVGVATIHCLGLWEQILAVDPHDVDLDALVRDRAPDGQIEESILTDWGSHAEEVLGQWREKAVGPDALQVELRRFRDENERFREEVEKDLLPADEVRAAVRAAGGPVEPGELHISQEEYAGALTRARFIRNRFTVLDLSSELFPGEAL